MKRNDILEGLNEAQREAVLHVEGPLLTLAGPGSGKTRVVTHRIGNLLLEGISPYSILALTFTNKAAGEMKKRLQQLVGDNPIWMGTFHGYCARFLRRFGTYVGLAPNFTIYDPTDAKQALQIAVEKAGVSLSHLNLDQILREISNLKNRLVTPESISNEHADHNTFVISKVYTTYQSVLLECAAVDFDDLLMHTAVILRTHPEIRAQLDESHRFVLVDEYQDTNSAQYLIVRALSQDYPNINVTGDPDQSIYGWRGANIGNILHFERDYPNVKIVRLEQNYRSTPQILSAADYLIQHNERRKSKTLVPTRPNGNPIRLCIFPTDRDEANFIADQILAQIIDHGRKAADFAILYRTNAQSRLLEQALISRRIGYQLIGGFRFYQRQEIKDLLAYLSILQNPTDNVSFLRVINTPVRGLGPKAIEKVKRFAEERGLALLTALRYAIPQGHLSPKATKGAKEFLKLYDELSSMMGGPIVEILKHLLEATDYVPYLQQRKTDAPDHSVQENINELLADAAQMDIEVDDGTGLEKFLEQVSLISDTDAWEATNDRVTLMTLHACKGLEFPSVFIIAIEHNILPHSRSMGDPNQMEEERRLFFVGITRAKDDLQLSMAHARGFSRQSLGSASQFLVELPRRELVRQDFTELRNLDESPDFDRELAGASRSLRHSSFDDEERDEIVDTDDTCQLPPDELAARIRDLVKERKTRGKIPLRSGSSVAKESAGGGAFFEGLEVIHPDYGTGRILSISGQGPRQIARIRFDDLGQTLSLFTAKSPIKPAP